MLTRRRFVQGTASIVAGAAAGMLLPEVIKKHGPVEIRTYFLSNEPIVIRGDLRSDRPRDIFILRAFDKRDRWEVRSTFALSEIERAAKDPLGLPRPCIVVVEKVGEKVQRLELEAVAEDGNLVFLCPVPKGPPIPIWIPLFDFHKVL